MGKTTDRWTTGLFCGFIGAFMIAGLALPDKTFSEMENRSLQQKPAFSMQSLKDGTFATETEQYVADQFPLRDSFVETKSLLERLWGKQENNGVYHAGDRLMERFDEPDADRLQQNIQAVNQTAAAADVPVYLALAPTAACIQKDHLPEGAPSADQLALLAQISEEVQAPVIDLYTALWEHRDEYIFYRTDHHWTSLGAYYGAAAVLDALGKDIRSLTDCTPEQVSDSFNGTLFSSSGYRDITPDTITVYVPSGDETVTTWKNGAPEAGMLYDRSYLETKDQYSMFMGGNTPLAVIETGNEGGKLMLVRDSYADSMVPFLLEHFSEIHLFDARYFKQPISQYAAENEIDEIVMLFSLKNYVEDSDLALVAK